MEFAIDAGRASHSATPTRICPVADEDTSLVSAVATDGSTAFARAVSLKQTIQDSEAPSDGATVGTAAILSEDRVEDRAESVYSTTTPAICASIDYRETFQVNGARVDYPTNSLAVKHRYMWA
ncbi:MAG: hypothetical protein IPO18_06140 [bacterium]|nr:hypothetical protein [bacterium]